MARTRPWRRDVVVFFVIIVVLFYFFIASRHSQPFRLEDADEDIRNQTLGFQEIFVLNLPERTDRRDAMTLAAALTGLRFTWLRGVHGDDVPEKALPPGERAATSKWRGTIGCWRSHLNALQLIVERNLATGLIMEDDIDWDVRLKAQLQAVSLATRAYLQVAAASPGLSEQQAVNYNVFETPEPHSSEASSPYGDGWDLMWLGHIGTELPSDWERLEKNRDHAPRSLVVVTIPDDNTVPAPGFMKRHPFADRRDRFADLYKPHTRLVHESRNTMGAQAYAVSQRGARRLLWQFGTQTFTAGWDVLLRDWCDGVYTSDGDARDRPVCIAVQPPVFSHYYSKAGGSDIHGIGGGYMKKVGSPYIRQSVRLGMEKMLLPSSEDLDGPHGQVDQWPDDGPGPW